MSVNVKGRNINVTPALKEYVEKKIAGSLASVYFCGGNCVDGSEKRSTASSMR